MSRRSVTTTDLKVRGFEYRASACAVLLFRIYAQTIPAPRSGGAVAQVLTPEEVRTVPPSQGIVLPNTPLNRFKAPSAAARTWLSVLCL